MSKFHHIPFTVETVVEDITEIPDGVKMIRAPEIWEDSQRGKGVVVAIIDSGCQVDHPDLKGRIIGRKNFVKAEGDDSDVTDFSGHGTHVAGTIAAVIDGEGVIGVAPEASLLIIKVMQKLVRPDGKIKFGASNEDIINAIDYCIQERVRVINMSLGGPDNDPELHEAIKRAVNNNILVVCAAGNEGNFNKGGDCSPLSDEFSYPGTYPEVVEVGAIGLDGKFPCFTNTNLEVDLVAPGVNILSTYHSEEANNKRVLARLSGTSMATPHVSGAAALIINQCERDFGRTLTEPEVYAQLIKRTVGLGHSPKIEGNGLLVLTVRQTLNNEVGDIADVTVLS